jgi:ribonuclease P protein component
MLKPFPFTFGKEERLCSQKLIQKLFGKSGVHQFLCYPLKVSWFFEDFRDPFPLAQVVFPVSKRNFNRAHDRNVVRRLMRESYRLQKHTFYTSLEGKNIQCILAISYIAKEKLDYDKIFKATAKIFNKIEQSIPQAGDISAADPGSDL